MIRWWNKLRRGRVIRYTIPNDRVWYIREQDKNGVPVFNLKLKGDTCHPEPRDNMLLTTETLSVAQSYTKDCHDNMNSEMFMQWVKNKLIPTFDKLYSDKMILVADNAPYHHKERFNH